MAVGLRALEQDRLLGHRRSPRAARSGRAASARDHEDDDAHGRDAGRTFAAAQKLSRPARQPKARRSDLFDLTPTTSSRCSASRSASSRWPSSGPSPRRPTTRAQTPAELLSAGQRARADDGRRARGARGRRRGALGGDVRADERGARAGRHGDGGRVPRARRRVDRAQPVGRRRPAGDVPAGVRRRRTCPRRRSRCSSRAPLFDPFELQTRARAREGGYVLDGVKSLVPRAADGELFIVARRARGAAARRCSSSRPGRAGSPSRREPAMGIRAAATGRLTFDDVQAARRRAARRRRPGRVRRVRPLGAPRLVRARRRDRRRRCSTT